MSALLSSFSNKLQSRQENITQWFIAPSVVLFVLTISEFSILSFPPDALFYVNSLPVYYWAGISINVASIFFSLFFENGSTRSKEVLRLIPLIMIGLYLYGTPVLAYEVPRFMDVFTHGAESLPILTSGHLDPDFVYSMEYPTTFLLLASSLILQDTDPLTLFRMIEIITMLLITVLVYSIAKVFSPKYATLPPLMLMGVFWVDQGHFSPQGLAIIMYLLFFLSMIKVIAQKESRRSWLVIAIIALVTINFTSPTNAFFLLLNLIIIATLVHVIPAKKVMVNRTIFFAIISATVFLGWSVYHADSKTILKAEEFGNLVSDNFGVVENVSLTPSPSQTFQGVNNLRMMVTAFVILSGIAISVLLIKGKQRTEDKMILLGWFATAFFILISMYLSPVLLSRNFMYISIPWSLLVGVFMANKKLGRWSMPTKLSLISFVMILLFLIPVTRYGRDPTTYVPSTLIDSAQILAGELNDKDTVVSYFIGSVVTKYFAAAEGVDIQTKGYDQVFQGAYKEGKMDIVDDWILRESVLNGKVIFSEPEKNNVALKYDEPQLYDNLEDSVEAKYNLILNNGSTRVYSSTTESAITPEEVLEENNP